MSTFGPLVRCLADPADPVPTGLPSRCHGQVWERSRMEWRLGSPGDPARVLEDFLADQGVTVSEIGRSRSVTDHGRCALTRRPRGADGTGGPLCADAARGPER